MYPSTRVKYLGVKINENFTLQHHVNDRSANLNKAFAPLSRFKKFAHDETVIYVYFIFESNLYCYSFYELKMLVLLTFFIKYVYMSIYIYTFVYIYIYIYIYIY